MQHAMNVPIEVKVSDLKDVRDFIQDLAEERDMLEARVMELERDNAELLKYIYAPQKQVSIDRAHLAHQREWSRRTFGPGARLLGVVDHIRKELQEIEADPTDLKEWVDVIILAFDGAWRAGWEPQEILDAIIAKQAENEKRVWPDWRTASPDKAIEHVK